MVEGAPGDIIIIWESRGAALFLTDKFPIQSMMLYTIASNKNQGTKDGNTLNLIWCEIGIFLIKNVNILCILTQLFLFGLHHADVSRRESYLRQSKKPTFVPCFGTSLTLFVWQSKHLRSITTTVIECCCERTPEEFRLFREKGSRWSPPLRLQHSDHVWIHQKNTNNCQLQATLLCNWQWLNTINIEEKIQ